MIKKVLTGGVIAVAGVALLIFFRSADITNYPPSGRVIAAFGDSLVEGVGSSVEGGFVSMVSQRIGIPIFNFGRSGDTSADALLRIDTVLARRPNVVIVLIGGNDALKRLSREETEANIRRIVSELHKQGAVVVLLGVRGGLLSDPYNAMYKRIARTTGSVYISNVLDGIFGDPRYMHDSIHPNDAGYEIIAARVAPRLKEVLNPR